MLFDGDELREMVSRTPNWIELRNDCGRRIGDLSTAEALALNLDLFIGVGNMRNPAKPNAVSGGNSNGIPG